MKIPAAKKLAAQLITDQNLFAQGWSFGLDNAKRRFGHTDYGRKRITISRSLAKLNDELHVRNTILHEIAHALSGEGIGHGPLWWRVATSIGCDGQRCYGTEVTTLKRPWQGICENCGSLPTLLRFTRRNNLIHTKCRGKLSWEKAVARP